MQKIYQWLYRLVISMMIIIVMVLSYLIYHNIPYHQLNISIPLTIKSWLPFDFIDEVDNLTVSNSINYLLIEANKYHNNTNQVISVCNGIVLGSDNKQVVILSDNGLKVYYDNLTITNVYPQERIRKGDILGVYEQYIELYAYDRNEKIAYEDFNF